MIKTPITVLQEMMIKLGLVPEYECVSQSGPQHQAMFEYRCTVQGRAASGVARSKKEAKHEAARRMLQVLHAHGMSVPPPYATPPDSQPRPPSPPSPTNNPALEPGPSAAAWSAPPPPLDTRSYVALLKELCEEYRLGEAQYELVGDTGPAHQRHFTVRASLGLHSRQCTSTTKKAARQQAAEQLYKYLRDNLSRLTGDFVEEEALARALEKSLSKKKEAAAGGGEAGGGIEAALERYSQLRETGGRCLDLGQRISEYHLGLMIHIVIKVEPLLPYQSRLRRRDLFCTASLTSDGFLTPKWKTAAAPRLRLVDSTSSRARHNHREYDTDTGTPSAYTFAHTSPREGSKSSVPRNPDLPPGISLDSTRDRSPAISPDEQRRRSGREALAAAGEEAEPSRALRQACGALGLRVEEGAPCGAAVSVLRLLPASPALAFAGADSAAAARVALRYLRRGLRPETSPV